MQRPGHLARGRGAGADEEGEVLGVRTPRAGMSPSGVTSSELCEAPGATALKGRGLGCPGRLHPRGAQGGL